MPTHREQFLRKHKQPLSSSPSLPDLAKISGVPLEILKEVYKRGLGAWGSNPQSVRLKGSYEKNPNMAKFGREDRLSAPQWAMARVYSFLNKGKTFRTADSDLARRYS